MPLNVSPQVVRTGDTVTIEVRSPALSPNRAYTVRFFSKINRPFDQQQPVQTGDDAIIRLPLAFPCDGEYLLDVIAEPNTEPVLSGALFALPAQRLRLWPYRGDTHMHTKFSDGQCTPLEMAVAAREAGMDFIVITDHDRHAPIDDCAANNPGVLVLQGEEVTVRGIGGHILSIGATRSVGQRRFAPEVPNRIAALTAEIGSRPLVAPMTAEQYAHVVWTIREIRQAGGIAAMAHPFWVGGTRKYYGPRCVFEQLLADRFLDAMELAGGSPTTEQNLLAVARYADELGRTGFRLPVLGGSDAHHVTGVARLHTMIFAPSLSLETIQDAIRSGRSVACDRRLTPDTAVFGSFEQVEYAYYLLREYYPKRDALRAAGDETGLTALDRAFWQPLS